MLVNCTFFKIVFSNFAVYFKPFRELSPPPTVSFLFLFFLEHYLLPWTKKKNERQLRFLRDYSLFCQPFGFKRAKVFTIFPKQFPFFGSWVSNKRKIVGQKSQFSVKKDHPRLLLQGIYAQSRFLTEISVKNFKPTNGNFYSRSNKFFWGNQIFNVV